MVNLENNIHERQFVYYSFLLANPSLIIDKMMDAKIGFHFCKTLFIFLYQEILPFAAHDKTGSIFSSRFVSLCTLPYVCFSRFGFLFIDLGKFALHCHDV